MLSRKLLYSGIGLIGNDDCYLVGVLKRSITSDDEFIRVGVPVICSAKAYTDAIRKALPVDDDSGDSITDGFMDFLKDKGGPISDYFDSKNQRIHGLVKNAFNERHVYEWNVSINPDALYVLDKRLWYPNYHAVLNLDWFDVRRLDLLMRAVKTRGAVTLFFKKESGGKKALDILDIFNKAYRYKHMLHQNMSSSKYTAYVAIDIVDLKRSWPIFNPKRCNGIHVRVYGIEPSSVSVISRGGGIRCPFEIIFSDYNENITDLDGEPLLINSKADIKWLKEAFLAGINYPSNLKEKNSPDNNNKGSQRKAAKETLDTYVSQWATSATTTYTLS